MKKEKVNGFIASAMALTVAITTLGFNTVPAKAETNKQVIEFENANRFSGDSGNGVRNDQFGGYSGSGYVYLAKGWAEVDFYAPSDGDYNILLQVIQINISRIIYI